MPEPIRVRDDKTGAEYSTYGVDEHGEPYEGLTKLDEDAVDVHGVLIPPKYDEVIAETPAPKPTAAKPADPAKATQKEN